MAALHHPYWTLVEEAVRVAPAARAARAAVAIPILPVCTLEYAHLIMNCAAKTFSSPAKPSNCWLRVLKYEALRSLQHFFLSLTLKVHFLTMTKKQMFSYFFVATDFIIDILLGCASSEVRDKASSLFFKLSQAQNQASKHPLTQVVFVF